MNEASELAATFSNPRSYCVANRQPPFRNHPFQEGEPAWRKVGCGLMAVTDGTPRQYIGSNLIFAVDLDADGNTRIAAYGCAGEHDGLAATKPYTYESVRSMVATDKIERRQWVTYEEMVTMIRRILPMAWVPTQEEFLAEYGLSTAGLLRKGGEQDAG